jgi:hypothetical protein
MRKRLSPGEKSGRDELPLIRPRSYSSVFILYVPQYPNYCVYIYASALDLSIYRYSGQMIRPFGTMNSVSVGSSAGAVTSTLVINRAERLCWLPLASSIVIRGT